MVKVLEVTITLQVNGKVRGTITMPTGARQSAVEELAAMNLHKWLKDKSVDKVIYVQDKLINYVVK